MKKFSLLVLIAFLATNLVRGATAAFTEFAGFGSVENAINLYAVPNSTGMSVDVLEQTPEGKNKLNVRRGSGGNINFTTNLGGNMSITSVVLSNISAMDINDPAKGGKRNITIDTSTGGGSLIIILG